MVKYGLLIFQHLIILHKLQYSVTESAPRIATLYSPSDLCALCIFELYTENKLMFLYRKGGGKLHHMNTLSGFTSFSSLT